MFFFLVLFCCYVVVAHVTQSATTAILVSFLCSLIDVGFIEFQKNLTIFVYRLRSGLIIVF